MKAEREITRLPAGNYKIENLMRDRGYEVDYLRFLIRAWQRTHGWLMRSYRRDIVRDQIKRIRIIDSNLNSWRTS